MEHVLTGILVTFAWDPGQVLGELYCRMRSSGAFARNNPRSTSNRSEECAIRAKTQSLRHPLLRSQGFGNDRERRFDGLSGSDSIAYERNVRCETLPNLKFEKRRRGELPGSTRRVVRPVENPAAPPPKPAVPQMFHVETFCGVLLLGRRDGCQLTTRTHRTGWEACR